MAITARYDREADALYVMLRDGDRARAVEIDEVTYVDVDRDEQALGLEFLYPGMGISLDAAISRFQLHSQRHAVSAAIAQSGAPGPAQTTTGTIGGLVSTSIVRATVEGTVAAAVETPVQGVTHPDRVICA